MGEQLKCFKCWQDKAKLTYEENRTYKVSCECGHSYEFKHCSLYHAKLYHCKMVELYTEIQGLRANNMMLNAVIERKSNPMYTDMVIKFSLEKEEPCHYFCDECEFGYVNRAEENTLLLEYFKTLTNGIPLDRLEQICQAERSDKFPPAFKGDTVFVLTSDSPTGIEETTVYETKILKNGQYKVLCKCVYDDWGGARWEFTKKHFGKTVFLSRGEAEKALERIENNDQIY